MKKASRILTIILALVMLASCFVFADTAKQTASASIVSPTENSITADDKLLVSVKVVDKKKISVTVFEEKMQQLDKDGKPVLDKDKKEVLLKVDVKDIKKEDFEDIKKLYDEKKFVDVKIADPVEYTAVGEAGYFSKTIDKLTSGLYRVQVDVLDKDGKVTESYSNFVALQDKPVEKTDGKTEKKETKTVTVETQKASIVQSVVKFLKSIVK